MPAVFGGQNLQERTEAALIRNRPARDPAGDAGLVCLQQAGEVLLGPVMAAQNIGKISPEKAHMVKTYTRNANKQM